MRHISHYCIAIGLIQTVFSGAYAQPLPQPPTAKPITPAITADHSRNPTTIPSGIGAGNGTPEPVVASSPYKLKNLNLDQVGKIRKIAPDVQEIDTGSDNPYTVIFVGPASQVTMLLASLKALDTAVPPTVQSSKLYFPRYHASESLKSFLASSLPRLIATPLAAASVPAVSGTSAFLKVPQTNNISLLSTENVAADSTASGPTGPGTSNQTSTATLVPLQLQGSDSDIAAALKLLHNIDIRPKQVVIEARLIEASPENLQNYGVTWTDLGGGLASLGVRESTPYPGKLQKFGTFTRDALNFSATINALIQDHKAQQIADPRTTVLNEQEGTIFIGDQLQYVVGQSTDTQGRLNFTLASQDVGINLIVKPIINPAEEATDTAKETIDHKQRVTLNLIIGASTLTGFVGTAPQVSTRRVNTTALVDDNGVLAIGGLTRRLITHETQKVPLLGDIPLIGQLFRNTRHDDQTTELIILLTLHVVKDDDPAISLATDLTPPPNVSTKEQIEKTLNEKYLKHN